MWDVVHYTLCNALHVGSWLVVTVRTLSTGGRVYVYGTFPKYARYVPLNNTIYNDMHYVILRR